MSQIKWIKITTDMFEDEKIDFIDSLPEKDTILILWVKLLTLAGNINDRGLIYLTPEIPYTDDMLSHKFKRPINTVKLAMETFKRLGMIYILEESGHIAITNWEKHQNIEQMKLIRDKTKNRVHEYRQRQAQKTIKCNADVSQDVTHVTQDVTQNVTHVTQQKIADVTQDVTHVTQDVTQDVTHVTHVTQQKVREQTKQRMQKYRQNQGVMVCNAPCNTDVTQQNKNKNKNKEKNTHQTQKSDVANFIDFYFQAYKEKFKTNPPFKGGRDGQTVKTLLKVMNLDILKTNVNRYFETEDLFFRKNGYDIPRLEKFLDGIKCGAYKSAEEFKFQKNSVEPDILEALDTSGRPLPKSKPRSAEGIIG